MTTRALTLNVLLALTWVLLTGETTAQNLLIGLVIGYATLYVSRRVVGDEDYFRRIPRVIRFAAFFLWELLKANGRMVLTVIGPRSALRPAVIAIPLDLRTNSEITLLSNLITLTPGTLTLDVSADGRYLYVHTITFKDEESFRREIKDGFERQVKELLR